MAWSAFKTNVIRFYVVFTAASLDLEYQFQLIILYLVLWYKYYKIFKQNRGNLDEIGMVGQPAER